MMGRAKCISITGEQLSFVPPAAFCPAWPTKHTLDDNALAMLMAWTLLGHAAFEGVCVSWRLAAVVFKLRALSWPIDTIPTPRLAEKGHCRNIALYRLPVKYIAQAIARGAHQ